MVCLRNPGLVTQLEELSLAEVPVTATAYLAGLYFWEVGQGGMKPSESILSCRLRLVPALMTGGPFLNYFLWFKRIDFPSEPESGD